MIEAASPERIAAVSGADLPRIATGLLVSGALAPALFILLNLLWDIAIAWEPMRLSSADPLNEAIGLCALVMLLGCPASITAALIVGFPGIALARHLRLTSAWIFCLGGAVLALGCTAWFARDDARGWVDLVPFAANMALTGACCGFLCWRIVEGPDRSCPETR